MGRFTADRVTRYLDREVKHIRTMDPHTPIYTKVHGGWWHTLGVDPDRFARVQTALGMDNYPYPIARGSVATLHGNVPIDPRFAADFWTQAIMIDTYRSLAPDKPIIDSEYHFAPYLAQAHYRVPPRFASAMLWQGALHGRDAVYIWVGTRRGQFDWVPMTGGDHVFLTQPAMVEATGHTALDLERLAAYALAFQHAGAEVALLRSGVGFVDWYQKTYFQDCAFDLVTPDGVAEGRLDAYKVLLVPDGAWISQSGLDRIAAFVRRGGVLCLGHEALRWNEDDTENDLSALAVDHEHVIRTAPDRVVADIDLTISRAGVVRPMRSGAEYVELRLTEVDGKRVLYAINFNTRPQRVTLDYAGRPVEGVELITGRRFSGIIEMQPLDVVLIEVE